MQDRPLDDDAVRIAGRAAAYQPRNPELAGKTGTRRAVYGAIPDAGGNRAERRAAATRARLLAKRGGGK